MEYGVGLCQGWLKVSEIQVKDQNICLTWPSLDQTSIQAKTSKYTNKYFTIFYNASYNICTPVMMSSHYWNPIHLFPVLMYVFSSFTLFALWTILLNPHECYSVINFNLLTTNLILLIKDKKSGKKNPNYIQIDDKQTNSPTKCQTNITVKPIQKPITVSWLYPVIKDRDTNTQSLKRQPQWEDLFYLTTNDVWSPFSSVNDKWTESYSVNI